MREGLTPRIEVHPNASFLAELVQEGAVVMVGGFGEPGTPFYLLDGLARSGVRRLTVIKNDANEPGVGIGQLLRARSIERLIASHIGLNGEMIAAMNEGQVEVEFHPQGILAEKIRCGGVGIPAFLSDIGIGVLDEPDEAGRGAKSGIDWEGQRYLLEPCLRADLALLHAHTADRFGNLRFRKSARNFNPLMALAGRRVVVEVEELVEEPLDAEEVHTPGCFVDDLVLVPREFDPGTRAAAMRRETGSAAR